MGITKGSSEKETEIKTWCEKPLNKRLVIYAVLLSTAFISGVSQIRKSGFTAKAGTCWSDESIFLGHNWTKAWQDLTEYNRPAGVGGHAFYQTTVFIGDLQPVVSPWNDTGPWGSGNTSIILYTFDFYPVSQTAGPYAVMYVNDQTGYRFGFFMNTHNATHCAFHLGDYDGPASNRVWGVSFRLAFNNWYSFESYAGLNRSCKTWKHRVYCYDAFGAPYGGWNKSSGLATGDAEWNDRLNISHWWGSKAWKIKNQILWRPWVFSPPPSDPAGNIWLSENRLMMMFLFLGLGMFLAPPSYIAYRKPPADAVILLLFVMIIGLAFLLTVAYYTPP